MPVTPAPSESELAERLAVRTLELIDIPSESRNEAALAAHVASVLREGGAVVEDLGDSCVLAYPSEMRPQVLLAGHLDTVPAQGNIPGRIDGRARDRARRVGHEGRARGDDRARARAGAVRGAVLPARGAAARTRARWRRCSSATRSQQEFVVVMEPTDGELHAGCLGNINATWTFSGRSGHSARPWQADNAIHQAALGIAALASAPSMPVTLHGLTFHEVASVTRVEGGIAGNVIPESCVARRQLPLRPGPHAARGREAAGRDDAGAGDARGDRQLAARAPWRSTIRSRRS